MASTLHQIATARDGEVFIALGPVVASNQTATKIAKNGKYHSLVFLKNGNNDIMMQLWGEPAIWKFPIGEAITIRGNFTKSPFNNGSINCDNLSIPAEWVKWPEPTSAITTSQSGIKECLDTGLRAADYMIDKKRPELAEAAFSFAANARLQGAKPE